MAQRLSQHIEHGAHPRRVGAPQSPRRLLVDIAIALGDQSPDRFEREVQRLLLDQRQYLAERPLRVIEQLSIGLGKRTGLRDGAAAIAVDQRQNALRQIAIAVGQIAVEPGDQAIVLRLKERLPEGALLTDTQMRTQPFELGLLRKLGQAAPHGQGDAASRSSI